MSNVAFYSNDMRWGGARSGVAVHDGLARGRVTAGGRNHPVPATQKLLAKLGMTVKDFDTIELNEAFAAQAIAVFREWAFTAADLERTNIHGSGISLGHPVGATGTRILTTLAREMHRRQARYGLETMCIGGGQGLAAIWERAAA